jgi:hypothetical protein
MMQFVKSTVINKYWFIVLAYTMVFSACNEKEVANQALPENEGVAIDYTYRPFLHKFTSTGCGGCGRFGIPVLSQTSKEMGDSIFALATHFKYNDVFITPSSQAIEQAILNSWHSPQIWVDNKEITFDIISLGIANAVKETKSRLRDHLQDEAEAYIGINSKFRDDQRYDIELAVLNNTSETAEFYVEVYGMEDGLVGSQAGADPFHWPHDAVNRGGIYGGMGKQIQIEAGAQFTDAIEYVPCWGCTPEDMYFNIVVWKKLSSGKYEYVNGKVLR